MTTVYCEKIIGQQFHQYRQKRTKQRITSTHLNSLYTGSGWGQAHEVRGLNRLIGSQHSPSWCVLYHCGRQRGITIDAISKRVNIFYKESFAIKIKSMNIN